MDTFERAPLRDRMSGSFDRLEGIYLKVLRVAILVIATLMIVAAIGLAGYSLYKISRSPDSVVEQPVVVNATDIVDAEQPAPTARDKGAAPVVNPIYRQFYDRYIRRYHRLFRNRFEPFRQPSDKQLSATEFGDNFIQPAQRIEGIGLGQIDFDADKTDLESLLVVMTAAAEHPTTQRRLKRYMDAKKQQVCHTEQRSRFVTETGWDRTASHCPGWYEEPIGCAVSRAVEKPYSVRQCAMEFPKDTQSHAQIFRAFQDRYLELLNQRRMRVADNAANERAAIEAGQVAGFVSLMTSLQVLGTFLVLMFFFLLIAIERHLRHRSADMRRAAETD